MGRPTCAFCRSKIIHQRSIDRMFVDRLWLMDGLYSVGSFEKSRFHDSFICLIHQANYVLDKQLKQFEAAFLKEGGLRERMTRVRLHSRKKGHHDA